MRDADLVEIEVVARRTRQQVDNLVRSGEPVPHTRRHRVGLGPDDLVTDDPAVCNQVKRQTFRTKQQTLALSTLSDMSAVGVPEVEPQSASWYKDTAHSVSTARS